MKPSLWVQMWIIWSLWLVQAEQVEFYFFSMELVISSPVCISKHCSVPIFIIIIFKKNWGKLLTPFWGPISNTVKLYLTFVADPLFLSCFPFKHEKTLSMKSSVSISLANWIWFDVRQFLFCVSVLPDPGAYHCFLCPSCSTCSSSSTQNSSLGAFLSFLRLHDPGNPFTFSLKGSY